MGWKERAGRILLDPNCAHGHSVATPLDRRWLWRLEGVLGVSAPMGSELALLGRDLAHYLGETCEHHWHSYAASGVLAAHRQCMWCNEVEWFDEVPRGEVVVSDREA